MEAVRCSKPCRNVTTLDCQLSIRAADHIHQLGDLAALVGPVARRDCVLDAMRDVIAEDFFLDAPQRCTSRRNLRDDIDAITIIFDHAGDSARLAFDPFQPFEAGCLDFLPHDSYIPP